MKNIIFNKQRRHLCVRMTAGCLFWLSLVVMSCSELPVGQISTDSKPPSKPENVVITPINGGAHITYTLPADDDDISYVKCEFTYNGKRRVVRSSIYKNYMDVDGIGAPEPIKVSISTVDHSENASAPHEETFTPLEPPMTAVFNSFQVEPAFGGIKVTWQNPARTMAGISFLAANDLGKLELKDMVFSSLPTGAKSLRGFNTDRRTFALSIVDKYENLSDTFKVEAEPLYEVMLDKGKFADAHLSGDHNSSNDNRPLTNIWDGNTDTDSKYNGWHTFADEGYSIPQHFTVDLGVTAKLTRILIYNRGEIYQYAQHNVRLFDIWGTDRLLRDISDGAYYGTKENNSNAWKADWTLLAQCEIVKPSGSPTGTNTPEDLAAHNAGFEFEFDQSLPKVQYLRFEVHETWARTPALHMAEISVFETNSD
ncbi:MAG: DUF4959 domain-containing protein [Bacteroidales bacterium]|jgi:hypothetical protein|nr:DUF4959 domain-containing protein [Bacteroidales bacterium]